MWQGRYIYIYYSKAYKLLHFSVQPTVTPKICAQEFECLPDDKKRSLGHKNYFVLVYNLTPNVCAQECKCLPDDKRKNVRGQGAATYNIVRRHSSGVKHSFFFVWKVSSIFVSCVQKKKTMFGATRFVRI